MTRTSALADLMDKDDTPTLWRDMTDAQKGALLLGWQQGKVLEFLDPDGEWVVTECEPYEWDMDAYRIRPEPKRETVTIVGRASGSDWSFGTGDAWPIDTVRITFDTIDGQPVADSVKLEKLT